jgi:hypothetical protein
VPESCIYYVVDVVLRGSKFRYACYNMLVFRGSKIFD